MGAKNPVGKQGALIHPDGRCALCRGLNLSTQPCRVPSLAALPRTGETAFSLRRLAPSTLLHTCREGTPCRRKPFSPVKSERAKRR